MLPLQIQQARKYSKLGVGLGGALLKHSLYPLTYLRDLLDGAETVFDLGCGEGMLTNLLSVALPGVRFSGVDLDAEKISLARQAATPWAQFEAGDFRHVTATDLSAVIFNDVLHHFAFEQQMEILDWVKGLCAPDGLLVLKEVDAADPADVAWTTFWDHRLYPQDRLNFRTIADWKTALHKVGLRIHDIQKVSHPWPASRTVLVATRAPKIFVAASALRTAPAGEPPYRVLVTGGSGFIGEHLLRSLATEGLHGRPVQIDAIARNLSNFPPDLLGRSDIQILPADLSKDASAVAPVYDYVFHLAADVDFFARDSIIRNNLEATRSLLERVTGGPLKRFVHTSTMGAVDRARDDSATELLTEASPAHPVSPYGRSKLESEHLVQQSGCPYTIVRVPWCYGPGMSRTHHVRVLFEKVMRRELIVQFDWPGRVSLIAVQDLVRLLIDTATSDATRDQLYFASDNSPISFGTLFATMGAEAGVRAGRRSLPRSLLGLLRAFHRYLPFQLKCLVCDALAVSPEKLINAGCTPAVREDGFLIPLARYIYLQRSPLRPHSTALITGAAGGIGAALARQAYVRGYALWLVDRNAEALAAVGARLSARTSAGDLSDSLYLECLEKEIIAHDGNLRLLINNAGIGRRGAFAEQSLADQLSMVQVNILALVRLTHASLRKQGQQANLSICQVSSSAAFQPLAGMSVYAASKSFVLSFSEGLAAELFDRPDVEVVTIVPSGTKTGFQQQAGVKDDNSAGLLDPNDVAGEILRCVGRGSRTHIIGRSGRMMSLVARLLPRRYQAALWRRLMDRLR